MILCADLCSHFSWGTLQVKNAWLVVHLWSTNCATAFKRMYFTLSPTVCANSRLLRPALGCWRDVPALGAQPPAPGAPQHPLAPASARRTAEPPPRPRGLRRPVPSAALPAAATSAERGRGGKGRGKGRPAEVSASPTIWLRRPGTRAPRGGVGVGGAPPGAGPG